MHTYHKLAVILFLGLLLISCGGDVGERKESVSPVVGDYEISINQNESKSFDVSDIGKDVGIEDIIIETQPIGSIEIDKLKNIITYTPKKDFFGVDSFTYSIKDKDGLISAPATITITISPIFGKLIITKTVTGDIADPQKFTIQLDCSDNSFDDDIHLAHGEKHEISNIPTGTNCNVTELAPKAPSTDYSYVTPLILPATSVVVAGKTTATFAVTNRLIRKEGNGNLTITKTVTGDVTDTQKFTLQLDCSDNSFDNSNILLAHDEKFSIFNIPTGTSCSVTEVPPATAPEGYSYNEPSISPAQVVVIEQDKETTINVNNELTRDTGKLSISKTVTGDITDIQKFIIQLDCSDNNFDDDNILLAHGETHEVANIPTGTSCKVTELPPATAPKGYRYSKPAISSTAGVVITKDSIIEYSVVNTLLKNNTGDLLITKTLVGGFDTRTFSLKLECRDANDTLIEDKEILINHGGFVQVLGLAEGLICKVQEIPPTAPEGYYYEKPVIIPSAGVTIIKEVEVDISVTNKLVLIELPFKMRIRIANSKLDDKSFEIPTTGDGYSYQVDCDNDGVNEVKGVTGNYACKYSDPGDYTISISGSFPQVKFFQARHNSKLISIEQWGTTQWRSMQGAFFNCANMMINAKDIPNLKLVKDMSEMFSGAHAFNQYIGDWDVSNVTNMSEMFIEAISFNKAIGKWNVGNVNDMSRMFYEAEMFNQDLSTWNVSNVTNMSGMFSYATAFGKVDNILAMKLIFEGALSVNPTISSWNVNIVKNMDSMFEGAFSFDQDLGNWNVGEVSSMKRMFNEISLSNANYNSLLNGWSKLKVLQPKVVFDAGKSKYDFIAVEAKKILTENHFWIISDGGLDFIIE